MPNRANENGVAIEVNLLPEMLIKFFFANLLDEIIDNAYEMRERHESLKFLARSSRVFREECDEDGI